MTLEEFAEKSQLSPEEFSALQEILKDPELVSLAHQIAKQCFIPEKPGEGPTITDDAKRGQAWFAASYFGVKAAKEHYRKQGIPPDVLYDTMTDITAWLRNSKRNYGVFGLCYAGPWQAALYHGEIVRRGRLECNLQQFYNGPELRDKNGEIPVREGDPVIQLHIPEDGPMDLESCGRSLKQMAEFFAEVLPDYDWKGFHCVSWIFDPLLLPMLPEYSNILKFYRTGYSYPVDIAADTKFRIFGTADPDKVEDPTSLQKKAAEFLRNGGIFKEGGIFIPRAEIEAVDFDLEKLLK